MKEGVFEPLEGKSPPFEEGKKSNKALQGSLLDLRLQKISPSLAASHRKLTRS